MMNANSPIWAIEKPLRTALCRPWPAINTPLVANRGMPMTTTTISIRIGFQYCAMIAGSTIIPTETKKMAPKRSFMLLIDKEICSPSRVSASSEPITNAPSADEKPAAVASATMPKQRPTERITSISSFITRRPFLKRVGIRYMPTTNQSTKKKRSLSSARTISPPANCLLTAIVESRTISTTARRSSTTRVPNTMLVKGFPLSPRSSKALMMMVVEDIESIPPRKIRSIWVQPIAPPISMPVTNIPANMVPAVIRALLPTFRSFLKLNSRPRANSRKIIPISDHCSTFSGLVRPGKRPKWGPTRKPATMYPSISGCFNALKIRVMMPAEMNIRARSLTRFRLSSIFFICLIWV